MSGPEHHLEAERLLAIAASDVSENMTLQTGEHKADVLAAAQAHATLALAAASVHEQSVQALGWFTMLTDTPASTTGSTE